jgi:hypothetical protein
MIGGQVSDKKRQDRISMAGFVRRLSRGSISRPRRAPQSVPMYKFFVLAAIVCVAAPLAGRAASPPAPQGVHAEDPNRRVAACSDFYEFANGAWRAQNPIPATLPRWSRRVAAHEGNWHREQRVLEELARKTDWPNGSVEQLLGNHYASCMDETAVEAAGVSPLARLLDEIDAIRSAADLQGIIRRLHELAVPAAFSANGEADFHNGNEFVENILPGALGLADRDYYLGSEPRFVEARSRYRLYMIKVLTMGGASEQRAAQAATDIVALEKRLAESSLALEAGRVLGQRGSGPALQCRLQPPTSRQAHRPRSLASLARLARQLHHSRDQYHGADRGYPATAVLQSRRDGCSELRRHGHYGRA